MSQQMGAGESPVDGGSQLGELIELDEARARAVRQKALGKLPASEVSVYGANGMVGGKAVQAAAKLQLCHKATLESLSERPFIEMVSAVGDDGTETVQYRTRLDRVDVQIDPDDHSTLVGWSSPLPNGAAGRKPGERVVIQQAAGRRLVYTLRARASFRGGPLPDIGAAEYAGPFGVADFGSVEERDDLVRRLNDGLVDVLIRRAPSAAERGRRGEYSADRTFGLGEILELADRPQRGAMQLPLDRHVLIEGPPGSGKRSVALMRVAVLIQEQFGPLGIDRANEASWRYHPAKTRVLVRHGPMVPYLAHGLGLVGQPAVRVQTVADFLTARTGGLVAGGERRDSPALARLKALPSSLDLVWQGFRGQVKRNVAEGAGRVVLDALGDLGTAGRTARDALVGWIGAVGAATITRHRDGRPALPASVNFARLMRHLVPRINGSAQEQEATLALLRRFATEAFPKVNRLAALFEGPQLLLHGVEAGLVQAGGGREEYAAALEEWREQATAPASGRSEADVALAALLASAMAGHPPGEAAMADGPAPVVGVAADPITHVVIDEAQDLTATEASAVRAWASPEAVVTAVGDLRQCVEAGRGLAGWSELGLPGVRRARFGDNYRQSWQVGRFVRHLHRVLFGEEPPWRPSTGRYGPKPRVRVVAADAPAGLAAAAAAEVAWIRELVARATVAVVVNDELAAGRLDDLKCALIDALTDLGVDVDVEATQAGGLGVRRRDCALLLSAGETKGLEFDGVVIVGNASSWSRRFGDAASPASSLHESERLARNRLYVAASRAQHCLCFVTKGTPALLRPLFKRMLCDPVKA